MASKRSIWVQRLFLFLPVAALVAWYPGRAPSPGAVGSGFSIDRATADVRAIAAQPHPNGSVANDRVRQFLVQEFEMMGLAVVEQKQGVRDRFGSPCTVRNLLVRVPGSVRAAAGQPTAILLAAHYDSRELAPGAGDDGAGVAALLETVRQLRAEQLRNDLIVLITDGEELGLKGAAAFCGVKGARSMNDPQTPPHPWLAEVALAMNFEARGTAGPSIMFETAPGNLTLIRHFAKVSPYPNANSLSYDVYCMLPNDTDFTIFRRAGLKGLNFAFIENYFNYHTKSDTPDNLDARSLYHHGTHALALARHFGNLDAAELAAITSDDQPNAVYFNIAPRILVRYSAIWIWPLTIAQMGLTAWTLAIAWRRRAITGRGLAGAFARCVLAMLLAPAAVYGLSLAFSSPASSMAFNTQLLAVCALAAVITLAVALEFRRRTATADLAAAGLILFSLLSIPMNIWMPGGSFITTCIPPFATIALAARIYWPALTWPRTIACMIASLPLWFIMAPLNHAVFTALTLQFAGPLAVAIVLTVWMLLATAGLGMVRDRAPLAGPIHDLH